MGTGEGTSTDLVDRVNMGGGGTKKEPIQADGSQEPETLTSRFSLHQLPPGL